MSRLTVTIQMPDESSARRFHLESGKAERFAAKVRADGGEAVIGPLAIGAETAELLARLNVTVR